MIYLYGYLGMTVVGWLVMVGVFVQIHHNERQAAALSPAPLAEDAGQAPSGFRQSWLGGVLFQVLLGFCSGLLWPGLLGLFAYRIWRSWRDAQKVKYPIEKAWLTEAFAVETVELQEMVEDPLQAAPRVPFGFLNPQWCAFRARLGKRDQLWGFVVPDEHAFGQRRIHAGYAIVRRRKPVLYFVTQYRD